MSKRFCVTFRPNHDKGGRLFGDRPGFHQYRVFPDRSSDKQPEAYGKYIVEIVNDIAAKRYCFVRLIESVPQIWAEIEPALRQAAWQRGKDVFSSPWTEIRSHTWGLVRVDFHDSRHRSGQCQFAYVTIDCDEENGGRLSFEVSKGAQVNFDELAKIVQRTVGPQADLAAAISRQTEGRRGQERWRR